MTQLSRTSEEPEADSKWDVLITIAWALGVPVVYLFILGTMLSIVDPEGLAWTLATAAAAIGVGTAVLLGLTLSALSIVVGCTSSTSSDKNSEGETVRHCTEPQNPYDESSGHYAGYEWAQTNNPGSCGGRSDSFIEGCEEYQRQESEYEDCEAKKQK